MRPALLAGLALAIAPTNAFAQSGSYTAVVTDPEVKLRATPSDKYDETATLKQGETVLVVGEDAGWLAVQDAPGRVYSVSWVQASFVDFDNTRPIPQNVMVHDDTTLCAGRIGLKQPMTHIRRAKVPAGTALTVIGEKVQFDGKWWHPVVPPAGDVRYLPRQAVRPERPVNNTFAVRDVTPPAVSPASATAPVASMPGASIPDAGGTASLPPTPVGKPTVQHPLWAQAEAAERDGKYDEAERIFFQLAALMNKEGGDRDVANLCYTRIHSLREKRRATGGAATSVATRPPASESTRPTVGTQTAGGAVEPRDSRPQWTGPGRLVTSGLALDGRSTYALQTNRGDTLFYVVPAQGVDLKRYVGKQVDVAGVKHTRAGLSKPYVVATAVEPVQ